jgi:indole-3-glycerol phosphate synthase
MVGTQKPSLDDILNAVREDLSKRRQQKTLRQHMKSAGQRKEYRDFTQAIRRVGSRLHWIGEIKRASPSAGSLREDLDASAIAELYTKKGASAISVLTESFYFKGSLEDLAKVREKTSLPILRKDFTIDEYQIVEAAAVGADAALLIVAILDDKQIQRFLKVARENNISCLVEIHNTDELNKALDSGAEILGINNRNLKTLDVDLGVTASLFPKIPKGMVAVSESGYQSAAEVQKAQDMGLDAILIGETLMRGRDIERTVDELLGAIR